MWKKRLAIAEITVIVLLALTIGIVYFRKQKTQEGEASAAASAAVSAESTSEREDTEMEEQKTAPSVSAGSTAVSAVAETPAAASSAAALSGSAENPEEADDGSGSAVSAVSQSSEGEEMPAAEADGTMGAEEQKAAEDPYADKPDIDINSWEFILANYENNIEEYVPETAEIEGIELDARIIDAMTAFVADCRAAGNSVVLASGYRDYYTQQYLFQLECTMYDEETAATIVARPGTSEHQTGLAADITDDYYEYKTSDLQYTAMYQWMAAHCQDDGFIVRFPEGKEDITRIIYEPWHFRYVGVEAATYIMEHDLTLEEFIELYK